jgi:hypothetical protein
MSISLQLLTCGRIASAVMLAGLLCGAPMPVRAEVLIAGGPDAIRLEASGASLEEALAALHASFNLRYRTLAALDGAVAGTYRGSLASVASRLLDGYDFVMKVSAENVEISVLRRYAQGEGPKAASAPPGRPRVLPVPPAMTALEALQAERRRSP